MANSACVFCDKKAPSKPVELHACVYEYVFVPTFEKENAKKRTFVRPSSSSRCIEMGSNGDDSQT